MPVTYEKRDHIGVVTLSRPGARNAWGPDFNEGLAKHFAAMEDDDEVRCAILTGDESAGAFSAGANLKDPKTHTQDSPAAFIKSIAKRKHRAFEVLGNFPKPLIGAVNGYAVGIGCIVTFCCDLLVASEQAEWRLPQVALGILPAYGGSARLARWVGRGHAMRLAMGFPLNADEAHRIGLAQWVVPHAKLMDKALEIAAAARRAAHEGIVAARSRHPERRRRVARRSLPLRDARADRGQGRRAPGLAREAQADVQRTLTWIWH